MRRYFKGVIASYCDVVIGTLVALLLIPLVIAGLGSQLAGIYLIWMALINFSSVGIGWLTGSAIRLYTVGERHTHGITWVAFALYGGLICGLLVLYSFGIGTLWFRGIPVEEIQAVKRSCVILGFSIWINNLFCADLAVLTATLRQSVEHGFRIFSRVIYTVLALIFIVQCPRIDVLMIAQAVGCGVATIGLRIYLSCDGWILKLPSVDSDLSQFKKLFMMLSRQYFTFGVVQFFLLYADIFIISIWLGSDAVTGYVILWKIPELLILLFSRFIEIADPYISRMDASTDKQNLKKSYLILSRFVILLSVWVGTCYGLLGPSVSRLWLGNAAISFPWWIYAVCGLAIIIQLINRLDVIFHYALARLLPIIKLYMAEILLKWALVMLLFYHFRSAAPILAFCAVQILGLFFCYRAVSFRLVGLDKADWLSTLGRGTPVVLLALFLGWMIFPWNLSWNLLVSAGLATVITLMSIGLVGLFDNEWLKTDFRTLSRLFSQVTIGPVR